MVCGCGPVLFVFRLHSACGMGDGISWSVTMLNLLLRQSFSICLFLGPFLDVINPYSV